MKPIDELIQGLEQLQEMKSGVNKFNLQDLNDWLYESDRLYDLAQDVRNQLEKAQEYHTDVDTRLRQQEYNHEFKELVGA